MKCALALDKPHGLEELRICIYHIAAPDRSLKLANLTLYAGASWTATTVWHRVYTSVHTLPNYAVPKLTWHQH